MKRTVSILILNLSLSAFNLFAQSGWFQLNSGTTKELSSTYFADPNTGYAVGDSGLILKTTNGGLNWSTQVSNTLNFLASVSFAAQSSGYIGYTVGAGGTILKTTNAGVNWNFQTSNINSVLYMVHAPSVNAAYIAHGIMDFYGAVLRTSNGGDIWSYIIASFEPLYCVYFVDALTGYAGGGDFEYGGYLIKTTNGGINWVYQLIGVSGNIRSLFFVPQNPDIGYAALDYGGIMKTSNAGANWNVLPSGSGSRSIFFTSTNTGYAAGGNGLIIKTTDGGMNWATQNTGTNSNLRCIFFADANTGYAVGSNGTILKTTSGGAIGIKTINNEIPEKFLLYQNYPNPFNPSTKIRFALPKSSFAKLVVYDILGREVENLVNEELNTGIYEVDFDGMNHPSGVYFYKLTAGEYVETRRMILLK